MTESSRSSQQTLRGAWTLARTELRTTLRNVRQKPRRLVGFALIELFAVVFPLLVWEQATAVGREAATGPAPIGIVAASYLAVVFAGGYVGFVGGFNQTRVGVVGPLIRTSIPPAAVSIGRFVTRTTEGLAGLVPTAIVLLVIVGVGASNPLVPILIGLGGVPMLGAGVVAGRLLGDGVRYANERLAVSLWVRAGVFLSLLIGIFAGTQRLTNTLIEDGSIVGPDSIGAILPGTPVQAYAALVLSPVNGRVELLGVALAGVLVMAISLGFVAVVRLETLLLVREVGGDNAGQATDGTHSVPVLFDLTRSGRIAWRYLLRTRRDPRTLAHLTPVLFGVLGMSGTVFEDPGSLVLIGPPGVVIAGAILAGGAFCLNPLGSDREQLPLLLTSTRSVGPLLRGRMLAGIVLGLVVAGVGVPFGLVEYSPAFVLGQALLAVLLAVAGTGTALGMGAALPKFERREYMSVERAHPSFVITFVFLMGGVFVGAIGFVLLWVGLTENQLAGFGLLSVYAVVLSLVAAGGYWYARRRFRALSLDDG